jgi:16S rRNA pseudouridine516 synthase
MERLDKILSNGGYCSRKQALRFLKDHEVTADGKHVISPADKVDASKVLIDNEPLDHPNGIFILLNKPTGYVCSHDIADGRLVYELLPEQWMYRNPVPSTIGRLDKDTTGVILITDNTKLIHVLTSPKRTIDKVYQVTVDKPLSNELIESFASGNLLLKDETKPCLPAKLIIIDDTHAEITLHEGRYHQVKRMFEAVGKEVVYLKRLSMGCLSLDPSLAPGQYRDLTAEELELLKNTEK